MVYILRHITTSIFLGLALLGWSQDSVNFTEIDSIRCFDATDDGHYYVVDRSNNIIKYSSHAKEISRTSIKNYGAIFSVDCSNPFEIYVYYKDLNIVVFLDNLLNVRGEMKLNQLGYFNVACVKRSFDNGVWIYDMDRFELLNLGKDGSVKSQSASLINEAGLNFMPTSIEEDGSFVYLIDPGTFLLKFDLFGTYHSTHNYLEKGKEIGIKNAVVYTLRSSKILSYDTRTHQSKEMPLKNTRPEQLICTQKSILVRQNNIIFIYPLF